MLCAKERKELGKKESSVGKKGGVGNREKCGEKDMSMGGGWKKEEFEKRERSVGRKRGG